MTLNFATFTISVRNACVTKRRALSGVIARLLRFFCSRGGSRFLSGTDRVNRCTSQFDEKKQLCFNAVLPRSFEIAHIIGCNEFAYDALS
jgi:hypothetical protein